ncbi:hypothetical protein [Actinopolymorpha pittospori]|uniref:Uncharacterized coiled-coil DUF342 family protein n=1 Tax=Actinopolymorpha pittospori TaxID=648752 RepID=A0A927NC61_9ACTN|nr:hypothetical protein [Actinopolymorpha pittospori]MBE1612130.1 uncharacterized coiled-coil DUF342 family protein [Actinopolymorpha pittospori]
MTDIRADLQRVREDAQRERDLLRESYDARISGLEEGRADLRARVEEQRQDIAAARAERQQVLADLAAAREELHEAQAHVEAGQPEQPTRPRGRRTGER